MADELDIIFPTTGSGTPYATIRRESSGQVADTTNLVFEAWSDGSITDYDATLSSQGGNYWTGDFPTWITEPGFYLIDYRVRAGASPTVADQQYPGERIYWSGTNVVPTPDPGGAEWNYADQQDVINLIGETNLAILSNVEPGTLVIDVSALSRAGEEADAIMDARLAGFGYTVPLAAMSAGTTTIMRRISARLVTWILFQPRAMLAVSGNESLPEGFDQKIIDWKAEADGMFGSIGLGTLKITATVHADYDSAAEAITGRLDDNVISAATLAQPRGGYGYPYPGPWW